MSSDPERVDLRDSNYYLHICMVNSTVFEFVTYFGRVISCGLLLSVALEYEFSFLVNLNVIYSYWSHMSLAMLRT